MTITITIYELSALIVAIGFLVLVITLIPSIRQVKKTANAMEELSIEGKKSVEHLNVILAVAGKEADEIKEVIERLKGTGLLAADLADSILENLKGPAVSIISLIFGAEAFLKCFLAQRRGENEGGTKDDKQQ
ncbi:MAG: hypothetical protein A3J24_08440 [Deltaproteobacteria bacterium RIFCSPLOWO2_02_FULL_53_8]|nr:MAG: hypothetical protein A3J24_08440 [Deltaproteobacteria bacterium RIFCSPLOWO2_02_FULL_53_8]